MMKYRAYASLLSFVIFNSLYAMEQMQDEQQVVKGIVKINSFYGTEYVRDKDNVVRGILKIVPAPCKFIGSEEAYFKKALDLEVAFTDLMVPISAYDENPIGLEQRNLSLEIHPALGHQFAHHLPLSLLKGKKQDDILKLCFYGKAVELKCVSSAPKAFSNELVAFEKTLANLKERTLKDGAVCTLLDCKELLKRKAIFEIQSTDIWGRPYTKIGLSEATKLQLLE